MDIYEGQIRGINKLDVFLHEWGVVIGDVFKVEYEKRNMISMQFNKTFKTGSFTTTYFSSSTPDMMRYIPKISEPINTNVPIKEYAEQIKKVVI